MTIHVTQDHIDRAIRLLGGRFGSFLDKFCDPITIAISDALKATRCMTHPYIAEVDGKIYKMSPEAIRWGNEWCQGTVGQPFCFELNHV